MLSEFSDDSFEKGDRVFARELGKPDVRGTIVWVGPKRYGTGVRYGVKDAAGSTYFFDGENVERDGPPDGSASPGGIKKGSRVRLVSGPHAGVVGDVYICGPTARIGIRDDDEETYWADRDEVELEE